MRRYVLAGASARGLGMYALPIVQRFADRGCLAGVFDPNQTRKFRRA